MFIFSRSGLYRGGGFSVLKGVGARKNGLYRGVVSQEKGLCRGDHCIRLTFILFSLTVLIRLCDRMGGFICGTICKQI